MRHCFIVNPIAGGKDMTGKIREKASELLPGGYEFFVTEYPGHATEIAKAVCEKSGEIRIYACGGDGTLNEVLQGMYECETASLGFLPIGTGNDFARYFSKDISEITLEKIVSAPAIPADILAADGFPCINIASAGLDAAIAENVHKFSRLGFRKIAYSLSLAYCFFTKIKNRYTLQIDGGEPLTGDFIFVCAANGKAYGGGFYAAPEAKIDDGYIDLIMVKTASRFKILPLISIYKSGRHIKDGKSNVPDIISYVRCKKVKISASGKTATNLDGEIIEMENPEISIMPGKIKLISI